jgi:hypothetical protein
MDLEEERPGLLKLLASSEQYYYDYSHLLIDFEELSVSNYMLPHISASQQPDKK